MISDLSGSVEMYYEISRFVTKCYYYCWKKHDFRDKNSVFLKIFLVSFFLNFVTFLNKVA